MLQSYGYLLSHATLSVGICREIISMIGTYPSLHNLANYLPRWDANYPPLSSHLSTGPFPQPNFYRVVEFHFPIACLTSSPHPNDRFNYSKIAIKSPVVNMGDPKSHLKLPTYYTLVVFLFYFFWTVFAVFLQSVTYFFVVLNPYNYGTFLLSYTILHAYFPACNGQIIKCNHFQKYFRLVMLVSLQFAILSLPFSVAEKPL